MRKGLWSHLVDVIDLEWMLDLVEQSQSYNRFAIRYLNSQTWS